MLIAVVMLVAMANVAIPMPSDAEVLRAIPPATRGLPFVVGEFRDDVVIVKKPVAKTAAADARWECTAYFTRTVQLGFPLTATVKKQCAHVVYIAKPAVTAGK